MTEILLFRGGERLLVVCIGGLAIYLGYRLFRTVELAADGTLEARIEGRGSLVMSRIGPGIFFALFGAVVVMTSLWKPVSLQEWVTTSPATAPNRGAEPTAVTVPVTAQTTVRQISSVLSDDTEADRERQIQETRQTLSRLGRIPPLLSGGARTDAEDALRKARLALVGEVWNPDWGDFQTFRDVALTGDVDQLPASYAAALSLFRHGAAP